MSAAACAVAPETARPFGRFALQRLLGEGAHATVWLGFDQRLEREVAVKRMRSDAAADPVAVGEWLREARSVSRLTHPNIVPVFEADVFEAQPYLVFEYVPGPTLAQLVRARGALPAHEAAGLTLGILDALHEAHAAGVVHRDLKPSNVLVGPGGRARVMDFGIAARLHDPDGADLIVGTPGYMSPEATRGAVPTATMDLFSVGLMLAEMLSGRRLVDERDPYRAMQRVADEDLPLPEGLAPEVNDALRAVLRRALERDPAARWQSAAAFREALQTWQTPAPVIAARPAGAAAGGGTLDFLLRRMRHKSDFPAMSASVSRIQRLTASDSQNLNALADEILKDVALTNKLLRVVNSASYGSTAGGIATVSRAIALVGLAGVRTMATSLVMLEHMHDKAHAAQLREEFLRALLAGMLAGQLGAAVGDGEEAFVAAMFHHLGRLLAEFYLPEEARQVRGMVAGQPGATSVAEANAAAQVLGITFEALGVGVARTWGLPDSLQACMRRPVGEPPARAPASAPERLRWLVIAANHVADVLLRTEPEQARSRLGDLARRYAGVLGQKADRIVAAATAAQGQLAEMVEATAIPLAADAPARRLFTVAADRDEPTTFGSAAMLTPLAGTAATPPDARATVGVAPGDPRGRGDGAALLSAGSHAVTDAMARDTRLDELLRMILETMRRGLGFRRVVFCLRDLRTETLTGRFGAGDGADALVAAFEVPLRGSADLFTAACLKGSDVLIADAGAASIVARLPAWYRRAGAAASFLLLPVQRGGASLGLIYADGDRLAPSERELALLRTLRNQAVLAFRQTG